MFNALLQVFEHGYNKCICLVLMFNLVFVVCLCLCVCVFKHLYCSVQLSMSNMEKPYRNKIITNIIIIIISVTVTASNPFHIQYISKLPLTVG